MSGAESIQAILGHDCTHIQCTDSAVRRSQKGDSRMESIVFPLCSFLDSESGAGSSRPAALPRISSRFGFAIMVFLFETTGCHTEVWGTEKLTGKQTGRQTMYEQMMNIVWRKKGREEGERLHCSVARRAYVPSTSESKESGGRGGGARGEDGWVKGRKDRMKKERGLQIRLRQSEQVKKGKNLDTCRP